MVLGRDGAGPMAGPFRDEVMQVLFGKAFLLELERGDMDSARIFARAFLAHTPSARLSEFPALA